MFSYNFFLFLFFLKSFFFVFLSNLSVIYFVYSNKSNFLETLDFQLSPFKIFDRFVNTYELILNDFGLSGNVHCRD